MKETRMLSKRKKHEALGKMLTSQAFKVCAVTAVLMMTVFAMSVFAADPSGATGGDAITTAKNLLSKAATAGGGLWAVWGLVTLGMSIKDSNGPGIGNAIWQILGGAIIIAAGVAIGALDLTMSTT